MEEKSENSKAADIYALGMTILEAMTGSIPYVEVPNEIVVMRKITEGTLPPRPEAHIPISCYRASTLWHLMNQCWSRNPQTRPTAIQVQERVSQLAYSYSDT
ncbi:Tyrosine kinase domain protein [Rhizoctonia solani]|uniref:Tyrosine kinase domain protein n=1 Tax=Rhizoctonia solani TaxID=456999 RepID=A0A8H8P904_9AGAM|nr:Tyrosine kinase domain protein [Rhizoctonia solani]QRW26820.1 Tyrosine kinase domain protein [Rhizoctonia solani]